MPILRQHLRPQHAAVSRNIVNAAQRESMPHVAPRPFFSIQVEVVLRNRRFVHGRPEVRRVAQVLRQRVVGQKAQPVGVPASHVDVARVVPVLRAVLQQVDGADRKGLALYYGIRAARG